MKAQNPRHEAYELYEEYIANVKQNADNKNDDKLARITQEQAINSHLRQEMSDIEKLERMNHRDKTNQMKNENMRIIAEQGQIKSLQKDYDQLPGFQEFPFTHGDVIEQRRADMKQVLSKEL